ncbi:hypothetical protein [Microseira sp. BLCC-F43]|jgi:hypothetical protein|uniref:hypothetical protein n=1 Tax=Microseira sp. BLCC-F43 TaxID=3153602 RepID=UPI0035B90B5E
MLLTSQRESLEQSSPYKADIEQIPGGYKGWSITTKLINGKLWLRWQHPKENLPRYGCLVGENGLNATIDHVRMMIDLMIKLESEVQKQKHLQQW